jgi:DNA-binding Lrp family transcriptional regulator
MKASDISDAAFVEAVSESARARGHRDATRWDVAERLGFPEKVVLAKGRRLIKRGLITGCACGCRGDWEVVPR